MTTLLAGVPFDDLAYRFRLSATRLLPLYDGLCWAAPATSV